MLELIVFVPHLVAVCVLVGFLLYGRRFAEDDRRSDQDGAGDKRTQPPTPELPRTAATVEPTSSRVRRDARAGPPPDARERAPMLAPAAGQLHRRAARSDSVLRPTGSATDRGASPSGRWPSARRRCAQKLLDPQHRRYRWRCTRVQLRVTPRATKHGVAVARVGQGSTSHLLIWRPTLRFAARVDLHILAREEDNYGS